MSDLDALLFGPGYCDRCKLIKPLAMLPLPGLHENKETGEMDGESVVHIQVTDRHGYCHDCAPIVLSEMTRKDA